MTTGAELLDAAESSRKSVKLPLAGLGQQELKVTLALARELEDGTLTPEKLEEIREVLKRRD